MKTVLMIILNLLIWLKVFATAQYPDNIIYNGIEYDLNSNPLEKYFKKNPDKRPNGDIMSSALWRGYVATFEIKDNQLYLKDIKIECQDTTSKESYNTIWESVINEVFPNQKEIKIDWLTGLLVIPNGELVNYVHLGYGSTYEEYILLEINKGDLKKELNFKSNEYEKFKEKQFQIFKQTKEYKKIKSDMIKEGSTDEFIDSFLKDFVTEYTSKILKD